MSDYFDHAGDAGCVPLGMHHTRNSDELSTCSTKPRREFVGKYSYNEIWWFAQSLVPAKSTDPCGFSVASAMIEQLLAESDAKDKAIKNRDKVINWLIYLMTQSDDITRKTALQKMVKEKLEIEPETQPTCCDHPLYKEDGRWWCRQSGCPNYGNEIKL